MKRTVPEDGRIMGDEKGAGEGEQHSSPSWVFTDELRYREMSECLEAQLL